MKKITSKLLILFTLVGSLACTKNPTETGSDKAQEVNIIPAPAELTIAEGSFNLNSDIKVLADPSEPEASRIAAMFTEKFKTASGVALSVEQTEQAVLSKGSIVFTTKDANSSLGKEGYELTVTPEGVLIKASAPAGLFYALQTLYQLLPPEVESSEKVEGVNWTLPAVTIKDKPRYSWRGMHLDVGRHMMPVEFIKKYVDNLALHKLNTFHWHLTEDQGWRIEIKKYPKLTEVGAWRKETLMGHGGQPPFKYDGQRYGGFYTQEEIKEVVKYAQERFITVVPEIELPGHATAAIAAYPQLGVTGKQPEVVTRWGVFPDIFNVDDSTFVFLENVLTEVMELFPSEYIHIGGDEAMKDQWKDSKKIQNKIKELGLKDEHELQSYFITRIEKFVNSKGRQIIGWDEILEGGLAPNAAVMSWRGTEGGIAAAKSHHHVVMSPGSHLYFDHYQADPANEPLAIGGFTTVQKVYSYEPTPEELTEKEAEFIMGAQANVWTEYMKTPEHVEYMVFPRISALAEVVWTPKEKRNWEDFKERIPQLIKRYDYRGINYSKADFEEPVKKEEKDSLNN